MALFAIVPSLLWMACGDDDNVNPVTQDSGAGADTSTAADTSTNNEAATDGGNLGIPIGTAAVPYDTWTWIPVAGTECANGSPTGIAINPHAGATSLTVYFEGGGACWADSMCRTSDKLASNLDGFGATEFAAFAAGALPNYALFERSDTANPLAKESFIYIPYCTGDIHAGNNVKNYTDDAGAYTIHHVGYVNAQKDLAVLQATFPSLARLIVTGSSAGGYGSSFNYEQFHNGFPTATPYLIDDSGPPLPGNTAAYAAQNAAWNHLANLPAGVGGDITNLLKYYTTEASFKGSLLETDHDNTISAFFGVPLGDENNSGCVAMDGSVGAGPCDFTTALQSVYTNSVQGGTATGPGALHALIRHATFHTFLGGSAQGANPQYDAELKTFIGAQLGTGTWADIVPTPF